MATQPQSVLLTRGGVVRLQKRLQVVFAAYQRICDDNYVAATCGESSVWHDSFDYEENQRQMHMLGRQVTELRQRVISARTIEPMQEIPPHVAVGAAIQYRVDDGSVQSCWIAGFDDGDPHAGRLAYNSPLGMALLGAVPGEVREWQAAGKVRELEILTLGPGPADNETLEHS